ncbi:MAG: tetratricopeptide repeat protein [Methylomonas sp.]|nr:tetratricopeptide repeat protein [Methylomonas sp.]PPD20492.1 MAG: hypothetical protein CTY23_08485 [Methylomonas sp.]PPD26828.1 MAG: hypothetical protein CTY22_04045 [Methylomonas sp.]PPD38692.1 MAG: hypothetical protein CTY21_04045 [Methylomonas sp.]PPD52918.1 MAG: hypothetical protein CTY11_07655 [Methylomonas sp.]
MSLLLNALKQAEKQKAQSGDGVTERAAPVSPVKADADLVELAMLPAFDLADMPRTAPHKQQAGALSAAAPASSPLELADIEPAATDDEAATPAKLPPTRNEPHHTASADHSQEHATLANAQPEPQAVNTTPAAAAPASVHPNATPQSQNPPRSTDSEHRLAQTLIAANARKTRNKPGGLRFIMLTSLSGLVLAAAWLYWQTLPTHDPYTAPIVETEAASTDAATTTVTTSAPPQDADVPTDTPAAPIDRLAATKTTPPTETPMAHGNSQIQPLFQPRPGVFQSEPRAAITPLAHSEAAGSPVAEVSNTIEIRRQRRVPDIAERLDDAYRAYQNRDDITATRLYQEVLAAKPGNIDALLGLGAIAERQGNTAQARHWFERALSLDGTQSFALNALARLADANQSDENQSDANLPNANPSERESRLKHLIDKNLANAATHAALGNLYVTSQRWRDAQSAYFAAVGLEPDNALYQYNLAIALDHLNKHDAALRYYRQALYLSEQQTPPFDRAALLLRIQQLAQP